jgi:DNA-binding response OmpR family regulator
MQSDSMLPQHSGKLSPPFVSGEATGSAELSQFVAINVPDYVPRYVPTALPGIAHLALPECGLRAVLSHVSAVEPRNGEPVVPGHVPGTAFRHVSKVLNGDISRPLVPNALSRFVVGDPLRVEPADVFGAMSGDVSRAIGRSLSACASDNRPMTAPGDVAREFPSEAVLEVPLTKQGEMPEGASSLRGESQRVLVVEDDLPLARLLCVWLGAKGYQVEVAHDGEDALARLFAHSYDLALLDLNLPKMDGLALLSHLQEHLPALPVVVLTGRNRTEDRVLALEQGADDCLMKPFSLLELQARMTAVLRRSGSVARSDVPMKRPAQGLMLNREEYRVERDGRKIELTPREFALLEFLMEQAPRPVSRATLMEQVWRVPFDPSTNIVDVYMKYLRDKIDFGGEQKLIRTVRGVGYALACA